MRAGVKKTLSVVAIYAIALHAVLWAFGGLMATASPNDPFSVICHSVAPDAAGDTQTPALPGHGPSQACDHCNLCSSGHAAAGAGCGAGRTACADPCAGRPASGTHRPA